MTSTLETLVRWWFSIAAFLSCRGHGNVRLLDRGPRSNGLLNETCCLVRSTQGLMPVPSHDQIGRAIREVLVVAMDGQADSALAHPSGSEADAAEPGSSGRRPGRLSPRSLPVQSGGRRTTRSSA